jgi:isochorismate synthase
VAGVWMGASPEPILEIQEQTVETVSLAGTQKLNGTPLEQITWKIKEKTEQDYVTQFIEDHLNALGIKTYTKTGPYNFRAANLVHLKSTFSFQKSLLGQNVGMFLSQLHPTPSVCGVPKDTAGQLIRKLEKHERSYYTGFLGPFQWEGMTSLFVNLRCMKILDKGFALYAGAGITAESVPENEWEETVQKMTTMLSVVQKENH